MKKIISLYIFVISLTFINCNDNNPITPIEPGSRSYEWKVYDLNSNAPMNHYSKLWGLSPNKIWIVGSAGDFDKTILTFDGSRIKNYGHLSIDPKSIFGLVENEVWFAGTQFDFWKYDGGTINKFGSYPLQGYVQSYFGDIWGEALNDLYAVGSVYEDSTDKLKSAIMHYDGTDWKYVVGPDLDLHILSIRKAKNDTVFYLIAYEYTSTGEAVKFFQFTGKEINPVVIGEPNISVYKGMTLMGEELFFRNETEIYKLEAGRVKHLLSLTHFPTAQKSKFWGRNEKDFFIQTSDGIGHYNGDNIETVFLISGDIGLVDGLVLNNDVYFLYFIKETFNFYLLYGKKLNE